jgi:hypothetical protein
MLAGMLLVLAVYTGAVTYQYGPDFLPVFFQDIASLTWRGQFNLDFIGFLMLSVEDHHRKRKKKQNKNKTDHLPAQKGSWGTLITASR